MDGPGYDTIVAQGSYIIRARFATFIEDLRVFEYPPTVALADALVADRYTFLCADLPSQKTL